MKLYKQSKISSCMGLVHSDTTAALLTQLCNQEPTDQLLVQLEQHHSETAMHSVRVGALSLDVAQDHGIEAHQLPILGLAALLHDIGKLRVPQNILNKASSLSSEERMMLNGHPRAGYLLLSHPLYNNVRSIVVAHHEWKRNAYPRSGVDRRMKLLIEERSSSDRRIQESTRVFAQIIAAADMYDALARERAYKSPLTLDALRLIMRAEYVGDQKYVDTLVQKATLQNT